MCAKVIVGVAGYFFAGFACDMHILQRQRWLSLLWCCSCRQHCSLQCAPQRCRCPLFPFAHHLARQGKWSARGTAAATGSTVAPVVREHAEHLLDLDQPARCPPTIPAGGDGPRRLDGLASPVLPLVPQTKTYLIAPTWLVPSGRGIMVVAKDNLAMVAIPAAQRSVTV